MKYYDEDEMEGKMNNPSMEKEMDRKMRREALQDLIDEMRGMDAERMGISPEEADMSAEDMQMAEGSADDIDISKLLEGQPGYEKEEAPEMLEIPKKPSMEAESLAEESQNDQDVFGLKEGLKAKKSREEELDELFRNR